MTNKHDVYKHLEPQSTSIERYSEILQKLICSDKKEGSLSILSQNRVTSFMDHPYGMLALLPMTAVAVIA